MKGPKNRIERHYTRRLYSEMGVTCVPMDGWDESEQESFGIDPNEGLVPPYVVVDLSRIDSDLPIGNQRVYSGEIRFSAVTHYADTEASVAAELAGKLEQVVREMALERGYFAQSDVTLHGLEVIGIEQRDNDEDGLHAEVVVCSIGFS